MQSRTGYVVETEHFTGPLDLLLQLVAKRKLFINDIALAEVADEYVAYVRDLEDFPVAEVAQFVVIAATLLLIKSKSLLPSLELTEEEEEDVRSLQERLRLYQQIKEQSKKIGGRFGSYCVVARSESGDAHRPITFTPSNDLTVVHVTNAARNIIATFPQPEKLPEAVIKKVVSLETMIEELRGRMERGMRTTLREFAGTSGASKEERVQMVVSFLAMLELVKEGVLAVSQDDRFTDIQITAHQEDE